MSFSRARYSPNVQTFTVSGTWTKPNTNIYSWAEIILIGGPGGGGGGAWTNNFPAGGGAGGGTSCRIKVFVPLSALSSTVTVTIGGAGTGGGITTPDNSNGKPGTHGGNTTFGSLFTAFGGSGGGGGQWNNANLAIGPGSTYMGQGATSSNLASTSPGTLDPATSNAGGGSSASSISGCCLGALPGGGGGEIPDSNASGGGGGEGFGFINNIISNLSASTSYGGGTPAQIGGIGGNSVISNVSAAGTPGFAASGNGYAIVTCY
jgi:hypothetical protein